MATQIMTTHKNPGWLVQIFWFFFVGVWLGPIWTAAAWFLIITVIGLPLGVMMINRLPKVIALREAERVMRVTTRPDGGMVKNELAPE